MPRLLRLLLLSTVLFAACSKQPPKPSPLDGTYSGIGANARAVFTGQQTQVVSFTFRPTWTFTSTRNGEGTYWIGTDNSIHLQGGEFGQTTWSGQIDGTTIVLNKGPGDYMEQGAISYRKVAGHADHH